MIKQYSSVDFERVVDFSEDIHRVKFDRPLMFPDVIGRCNIFKYEILYKKLYKYINGEAVWSKET